MTLISHLQALQTNDECLRVPVADDLTHGLTAKQAVPIIDKIMPASEKVATSRRTKTHQLHASKSDVCLDQKSPQLICRGVLSRVKERFKRGRCFGPEPLHHYCHDHHIILG